MAFLQRVFLLATLAIAPLESAQQPVTVQRGTPQNEMPSGGYKPPALSLGELMEHDHSINEALMRFARTGDKQAFRATVLEAAGKGDLTAQLLLAQQYIPERCSHEPNQDVPHCGTSRNESPSVVFRANPLGIDASYENACTWLEKASAEGSGEASEILAQLITRMRSNGHRTHYTAEDSARFHALARTQGFDVEPVSVTCYRLVPGNSGITLGRLPNLINGSPPEAPFTSEELHALKTAGVSGLLLYGGGSGFGESSLIADPEGPAVHVRVILDHDPGSVVLLPMPAHHDVVYLQHGSDFLAFPNVGEVLPRHVSLTSQPHPDSQVLASVQQMSGAFGGGFCARFPE